MFPSYEQAKELAQQAGITTAAQYKTWKDRPENLPADPSTAYKSNGWKSWFDFLKNKK